MTFLYQIQFGSLNYENYFSSNDAVTAYAERTRLPQHGIVIIHLPDDIKIQSTEISYQGIFYQWGKWE